MSELGAGRTNQKQRTRMAILEAARELIDTGAEVTMPEIARAALVSEATAYRYFPDLPSLISEALAGAWPSPEEAFSSLDSEDPVERVGFGCEFLLRGILAREGAVRAMIAATVNRPDSAKTRPGIRFGVIDYVFRPCGWLDSDTLTQLKQDLAIVVSAEALFTLTDLCGLSPDDAVASAVRTAKTLTEAATARR
ncbi:TetR/AcrR family transcriptional regulator [Amycolatopsis acidicola]|uniref:TetR/AcrR family transcriptional regulator n=1 Tax=Amycolatopsis acidicola TaxID=2596893 RepID=A0A5N0V2K9_9PSEU|nr:TetR/AcrR family transcriptional regulator [Amycolatopsis acidicola]KAA9159346.1 TetR/AcrR family transcriptional regulator [Amycolatopsis acidicola]